MHGVYTYEHNAVSLCEKKRKSKIEIIFAKKLFITIIQNNATVEAIT